MKRRKRETEVTQLHPRNAAKFIFVDYSGKHTSAVFHNSDYPLLHWQSEVLPEVPFIDP